MAGITDLQTLQVQRVVSNLMAGVSGMQDYIAEKVLPKVNTNSENFSYATWGNEALRDVDTLRGMDADPNVVRLGTGKKDGELDEHTLETRYDYRRLKAAEEAGNGDAFRVAHLAMVKNLIQIQKEKKVADIVFGSGNYTGRTSSAINFSTTGIRDEILKRKDERAAAVGVTRFIGVAGKTTHRFLLKNPDLLDLIKGGARPGEPAYVNASLIADYLELDGYFVGRAVTQASAAAGASGTATDIWTADSFAIIPVDAQASLASPAFAKLFYMNSPYSGSEALVRTWTPDPGLLEHALYSEFFKPATVMTDGGFLWTDTNQA